MGLLLSLEKGSVSRGEEKDVFQLEEISPSKCLDFLQLLPAQTVSFANLL